MEKSEYIAMMNKALKGMLFDAFRISLKNPPLAGFILRLALYQRKAARTRRQYALQGIKVPPYLIASITNSCNLNCKGCYAMAKEHSHASEMDAETLKRVMSEAYELGISVFMLAGGEPFLRSEVLDITAGFPKMLFPIFTNGMLLDDDMLCRIKRQKNVVPVISIEGYEDDTDSRRGEGVYQRALQLMGRMKEKDLFYGTSITVTRSNLSTVTSGEFVGGLVGSGCRVVFYVEYVPFKAGTEDWVLSGDQKSGLKGIMQSLRSSYPALFIAFPEDEAEYGGCLSSGRGFVHVSPSGDLEPCPFAPYSDVNLKDTPLKEALRSELLETIRHNRDLLDESKGGCALWDNRAWVASLAGKTDLGFSASDVKGREMVYK